MPADKTADSPHDVPPDTAREALGQLYREHSAWLQSWLLRRLDNRSTAADLAQDTFVRLLVKRERPDILNPRAYLATVAGGLLNNHWRRQALEQAWLDALAAQPEAMAPSPEERCLVLEALTEIAQMLDGLKPRDREIFLLSQMEGLTYPQIAARLQVTVNVVQKAMLRAVGHCHRILHG